MKLLAAAEFVLIATIAGFSQNTQTLNAPPGKITLLAEHEIKQGGVFKLRGHVEVITDSVTVYADEGDYNPLTSDLNVRGNVHVNFKKPTNLKITESTPEDLPVRDR